LTVNRVALKNMRQTCRARIRVNDWVQRKAEITRTYLEMFRTASSHIIIMSPYFLPGHEFRKKMKQAVKRGVTIQIILAGVSDVAIAKYAERFMYRWLFRNRIQIYEYQKNILHGKLAVCDGEWMTVGSYNVNNVSAYASVELNVDVDHKPLSQHTEMRLREIITKDCVQITEESYKDQTSFLERLLQRLAYNTFRIVLFLFTFYFRQGE